MKKDYNHFGLMNASSSEEFLDKVSFFVDGDRYTIWKEWKDKDLNWSNFSECYSIKVGEVNSMGVNYPVMVTFKFSRIGDTLVAFYESNSRCCDWNMIEDYITEKYPIKYDNDSRRAMTNIDNFHNCYSYSRVLFEQ